MARVLDQIDPNQKMCSTDRKEGEEREKGEREWKGGRKEGRGGQKRGSK